MRKEHHAFYNKKESDIVELNKLREKTVNKLPEDNVFKLIVINLSLI
jgi:hypothetical protein